MELKKDEIIDAVEQQVISIWEVLCKAMDEFKIKIEKGGIPENDKNFQLLYDVQRIIDLTEYSTMHWKLHSNTVTENGNKKYLCDDEWKHYVLLKSKKNIYIVMNPLTQKVRIYKKHKSTYNLSAEWRTNQKWIFGGYDKDNRQFKLWIGEEGYWENVLNQLINTNWP